MTLVPYRGMCGDLGFKMFIQNYFKDKVKFSTLGVSPLLKTEENLIPYPPMHADVARGGQWGKQLIGALHVA